MITSNQAEKTEHSKFLFAHLWRGNTADVLIYLKTQIKPRNQQKLSVDERRELVRGKLTRTA